ncbi:AbrB/MazE/SpoVT family DNA-binding domain-containing protein [Enterococcus casseliflavus]|uniref:AbrB/MazE/SpoVT family DNA-binding domain-containing protein n=1 Tax=Enterococcus casseliflavus TaxID=37734 RepID=UPI00233E8813|nr:AbrB/MazE/SpoVT family DNA-binding domain-containing protein [Enterococcus casseliflavus]MDB1700764.1 AbrB/MazE/SpoVT family DNA-binding domain-containing protein [Enterococcus casseliflavus]
MTIKAQVSAKMISKNQITIPKSVRQILGLKENHWVIFEFTPSFEAFWKQELAIIEEMGKFDTGEMFFEKDLGEENIEW